ncbi:hypothetical protein HZB74_01565 [Candidatus Saccharibacteria bacterium]|nr:hypothetical protein [Candidatus Saccharibacteria bacterium]
MAHSSNKTILFTRPDYDLVTNYLFYWTTKLLKEATDRGHGILDLESKKAIPKELNGRLKKMKPELCVINGHGSETTIYGYDNEPLVDASNLHFLKGTIMYARSCSTGAQLGQDCVDAGVLAYIGYSEKFWLCYDIEKTHHPLEDKIANYVMMPSNQVVVSLLKGKSAAEATKRSIEYSKKMMKELMSSDAPEGASDMLACVFTNMKHQVCLGKQDASI